MATIEVLNNGDIYTIMVKTSGNRNGKLFDNETALFASCVLCGNIGVLLLFGCWIFEWHSFDKFAVLSTYIYRIHYMSGLIAGHLVTRNLSSIIDLVCLQLFLLCSGKGNFPVKFSACILCN